MSPVVRYAIDSRPKRYVTIQAILSSTRSKSASGLPNCSRSDTWPMARSSSRLARPTDPVPRPIRPFVRIDIAILKPSPGSPSTFSGGTRTSLNRTGHRWLPCRPSVL
jgi:hypothetical protein